MVGTHWLCKLPLLVLIIILINQAPSLAAILDLGSYRTGPFTNEELVGRAIKGARDSFTIATKFAVAVRDGQRVIDCSPEYIP